MSPLAWSAENTAALGDLALTVRPSPPRMLPGWWEWSVERDGKRVAGSVYCTTNYDHHLGNTKLLAQEKAENAARLCVAAIAMVAK